MRAITTPDSLCVGHIKGWGQMFSFPTPLVLTQCFVLFAGNNCPQGVQSLGSNLICNDGEVGVFLCTTVESSIIGWKINEITLSFSHLIEPGDLVPISPNGDAVAFLVRRVSNGIVGNRTSILHYMPTFNTVESISVVCTSDTNECGRTEILVYGKWRH